MNERRKDGKEAGRKEMAGDEGKKKKKRNGINEETERKTERKK